jgi:hypothetical protein
MRRPNSPTGQSSKVVSLATIECPSQAGLSVSNPRGVKSANTDFDPVFQHEPMPEDVSDFTYRIDFWMLFLVGHVPSLGRTGGSIFLAD